MVAAMPILVAYAVASTVMRRSGGDYVFISRLIHPALGFAANFVFVAFRVVFLTSAGYYFCQWCLSPLARLLGIYFGSSGLITFSNTLLHPLSIFIVSEVFVIGFGAFFVMRSIRGVLKIFRYSMIVSAVGFIAFAVVMLFNSHASLVAHFNNYVHAAGGVAHASSAAAASAKANGFGLAAFSLGATFLAVTWPSFSLPYYVGSAYFAGEVRTNRKAQMIAGPLTCVVAVIGSIVLVALSLSRLGSGFLGSIAAASPAALGLTRSPTYMEIAAGASGNTFLGLLIILGFGSWLFPTVPMSLLIMSRCMFGWSMDRVTPNWMSRVNEKTNSPYAAVIVVTVISAIVTWWWAYGTIFTVVVGAFGQVVTLGIGCLAAALIPYKFPDLYAMSPIRGKFGPIPKITVIGVLGAIGAAFITWTMARDPSSGIDAAKNSIMFWFSIGLFPFGGLLYYIAKYVRRRQNVDITLAFQEIPPD
jgi:amino acid transporter